MELIRFTAGHFFTSPSINASRGELNPHSLEKFAVCGRIPQQQRECENFSLLAVASFGVSLARISADKDSGIR